MRVGTIPAFLLVTMIAQVQKSLAVVGVLCSLAASCACAGESSEEALDLCHRAAECGGAKALELLDQGLELAEAAVAADGTDARARLALFCTLGKQIEREGIGFGTVSKVRRLRAEIDLAMDLAPRDADILAAKGSMLVELPKIFGGDPSAGEELLRRSLSIRSDNEHARSFLIKALEAQGASAQVIDAALTDVAAAGPERLALR